MKNQHLFVIDPLASLNMALDSSMRMMEALVKRGDECFIAEPRHISWHTGKAAAHVTCQSLDFHGGVAKAKAGAPQVRGLDEFAAIHMRKDPPYDLDYITTTWMLDSAFSRAKIYNNPSSLRSLNEKLAIFQFKEACAPALASADPDELFAFLAKEANGDGILKPLTLFGGRGVERINIGGGSDKEREKARAQLVQLTENGKSVRLIQPFDSAVFDGEVRVFTAFAEPLAWCLKRPAKGNCLANTRAGATLEPYHPSPMEEDRVRAVAEALLIEGVVMVGFDLIGGLVSEINITSPRLLVAPGDDRDYYGEIAKLIIEDLKP